MTQCYLVDIDGTIADCSHRRHYVEGSPKDWDAFHNGCKDDKPFDHMRLLIWDLYIGDLCKKIVYVSGRPERCRMDTGYWLRKHHFPAGPLYMRKDNDFRDDDIIKIELLAQLRGDGYEPIMAFDDRNRVVRAWRNAGIPCAQVAEGDF